jgi:hypothetical protein
LVKWKSLEKLKSIYFILHQKRKEINRLINMRALSLKCARVHTILWFVFLVILLPSMVGMLFISPAFSDSPVFADINGDGIVDVSDYVNTVIAFGSTPKNPNWDPSIDLNPDGVFDITDLVMFLKVRAPLEQESIFFEYGAESGGLNPSWSSVGISPGGTYCSHTSDPSGVWISSTHARTGTKSMYYYQHAPPKDNPCRRITNRYYGSGLSDEYYFSWWVYFPSSDWDKQDGSGWGTVLGGVQIFWGPSGDEWRWSMGVKFFVEANGNKRFYLRSGFGSSQSGSSSQYCSNDFNYYHYSDKYLRSGYMDQWVHFQVCIKYRQDGTGEYAGWINDDLVYHKTGLINDPRGYSEWNSKNCKFAVTTVPWIVTNLYQSLDSPSHHYWVDDCVGAYQKVPEDYGVVYP